MQSYKKIVLIIPALSWLRIMPLVGYSQTNEGITDGSSASGSRNAYGLVLTSVQAQPYSSRQAVLGW